MDITALEHEEQLALVGLAKIVVRADQEVSAEESDTLLEWANTLGHPVWTGLIREASERFTNRQIVLDHARTIERQEARNLIYGLLYRMAHSDSLVTAEARILNEVSEMWEIAEQVL